MTATFTFDTSPVTAQGLQTMAIAAGAITKLGDPSVGIEAFSATFRYDVVLLHVTATTPSPNSVLTLPGPFTYDVTFNEPIDPASVTTGSLVLSGISGATVTGATVLSGNTTARFTIDVHCRRDAHCEHPVGDVTDQYGNPGAAFSASLHRGRRHGGISRPTDARGTARFPDLRRRHVGHHRPRSATPTPSRSPSNPGQTITVLVTPTGSGRCSRRVQLLDPTNAVIGTATAAAAGLNALIQATAHRGQPAARTRSSSAGRPALPAITPCRSPSTRPWKSRAHVAGNTNNTLATAENIDGSFVSLAAAASNVQRGAVLGQTDAVKYTAQRSTLRLSRHQRHGDRDRFLQPG